MKWNLIRSGQLDASMNMALDEVALDMFAAGEIPATVRLYGWSPSAVSIGYSQDAMVDANPDECAMRGFDFVRRITGGGAVFHHGEITYSIVADSAFLGDSIAESCRKVSLALVYGLEAIGISAGFVPDNDVLVNGKKVSGSAQARRGGAVLQHGTLLLKLDRGLMFSLINMPRRKIEDKRLASPGDRVTCVEEVLGMNISNEEAESALAAGFMKWLGEDFEEIALSEKTIEEAQKLAGAKYSTHEWNFERKSS